MTLVLMPTGDYTGWDRRVTVPGEVMAWNWPKTLAPCDAAFGRCFRAEAVGTISGDLAIRTEPDFPPAIVSTLQRLIMLEQAAGRPVGLGLLPGRVEDGDDPTLLYASLYAVTPGRLDRHFSTMSKWLEKMP